MHNDFLKLAIDLAIENVNNNQGGPFGALIVRENKIIARSANHVTTQLDPTAHAEILAIRQACQTLNDFQLSDCILYSSCEPCPMCLGAIYWARLKQVYYACSHQDAAAAGFDDSFIYHEITTPESQRGIPFKQITLANSAQPFENWAKQQNRVLY